MVGAFFVVSTFFRDFGFAEGTFIRKNPNKFGVSLIFS